MSIEEIKKYLGTRLMDLEGRIKKVSYGSLPEAVKIPESFNSID
jgi:hypothetical protein